MTLNEDYMDESDAERDEPYIDYHLIKKFTAKLPKIGSRARRIREGDGAANPSRSGQRYLSPLAALTPEAADASGTSQKFNVRSDTVGPESKQQYFRSTEGNIKEKFNISPSRDSQDSIDSSELRKKKKPLFQRMLERARQEDILKGHKVEKPLYLRLLDNIRPDSERDDRKKLETYADESRTAPARSRIKLPKIFAVEKSSPAKAEPSPKGSKSTERQFQNSYELEKEMTSSKGAGRAPKCIDSTKEISHKKSASIPVNQVMENSRSIESLDGYQKRKVTKKPLFQRLLERAQADEERAMRKKIDQYNLRKVMKKKSNAPSKEEIKERIDQGLARNDMSSHILRKDVEEEKRLERDKERETIRIRKRQRAMSVQSVSKGHITTTNPLKIQNQNDRTVEPQKSRRHRSHKLKKNLTNVCIDDDDDEGYGGDTGDNNACAAHIVRSKGIVVKKSHAKALEKITHHTADTEKSVEADVYASEADSRRMADMMSELHDEHDSIIDSAVPIVSYDSPSSINLSDDFGRRESSVPDDIDALFPTSSIVSNDSDTFMRKLKELNQEAKSPTERWSPLPPRSRNRSIDRDKSNDRNDDRYLDPTRERSSGRIHGHDRDNSRDRNSDPDRERNSDRDRDRDRSGERLSDRERDRNSDRDYGRDRNSDRDRDRNSDRDRDRISDRDRDRDRSSRRSRNDDRDHGQDNSRDREHGRDRVTGGDRDRDHGRDRVNSGDRDREHGRDRLNSGDRAREISRDRVTGGDRDREISRDRDHGRDRNNSRDRDSDHIAPAVIQERNADSTSPARRTEDVEAISTGRRHNKNDCTDTREEKNSIRHLHARTLSGYVPKSIKTSTHSNQGFGLVGPQWVAETLESDENEMGLVLMYSEGFSIFMAEEGTVSGSRNINTPPLPV